MLTVDTLSSEEAASLRGDVLAIWSAAFGRVEDEAAWTVSPWDSHRNRAGYRLAIARERDRLLGFAWGYTGDRGQYWPDLIARELGDHLDEWIGGHFEFVELAVLPEARRSGIGRRLHDALLSDLPHARALLATSDRADDPAVRLYSSRGWTSLGSYGDGRQVMGLRLAERTR